MHPKARTLHPITKRIYVSVLSNFDSFGHVTPKSIYWKDGRVFEIEKIHDFRPASTVGLDLPGDCYNISIHGQLRHLFFERTDLRFCDRLGRWFVEYTDSAGEE